MSAASFHREDIKAVLRKRHGSVHAFATKRNLKPQAIADWFRGRTNAQVAKAIESELRAAGGHKARQSIKLDNSADDLTVHRLNAEAR